ncbi:unnamed protein product [Microthlaspi erraticum]|uniref:Uncharacterized protein n=1 Tax=Microthlaspi erraticum TaxID=1685480 RepID=A0A6D2IHP0_9BRAS|nr:unnamed protein product [Microthlaspi erraticum]
MLSDVLRSCNIGNLMDPALLCTIKMTAWKDFGDGILILSRLYLALSINFGCFDDCQLSWAIVRFKQDVLKKLEDRLTDVNGFARETIESNIFDLCKSLFDDYGLMGLAEKGVAEANEFDRDAIETDVLEIWKSLFDVEAKEATPTLQATKNGILSDLFQPIDDKLAAEPQQY